MAVPEPGPDDRPGSVVAHRPPSRGEHGSAARRGHGLHVRTPRVPVDPDPVHGSHDPVRPAGDGHHLLRSRRHPPRRGTESGAVVGRRPDRPRHRPHVRGVAAVRGVPGARLRRLCRGPRRSDQPADAGDRRRDRHRGRLRIARKAQRRGVHRRDGRGDRHVDRSSLVARPWRVGGCGRSDRPPRVDGDRTAVRGPGGLCLRCDATHQRLLGCDGNRSRSGPVLDLPRIHRCGRPVRLDCRPDERSMAAPAPDRVARHLPHPCLRDVEDGLHPRSTPATRSRPCSSASPWWVRRSSIEGCG